MNLQNVTKPNRILSVKAGHRDLGYVNLDYLALSLSASYF